MRNITAEYICAQLAWAASNGIEIRLISMEDNCKEIMLSHRKSKWDFTFNVCDPRQRTKADKVIVNWINGVFPKENAKLEYP